MLRSRISVAMAAYNGAAHIERQLVSIVNQTRLPDELIVSDDGSADDTYAIVKSMASSARFPIRVERNQTRLGITQNFAQAISRCSGDIIFLADRDDRWHPHKIAKLVQLLEQNPQAGAAFSNGNVVGPDYRSLNYTLRDALLFDRRGRERFNDHRYLEILFNRNVITGSTMAFWARYKPLIFPFPTHVEIYHDYWINLLIGAVAPIVYNDEPLIEYTLHSHNTIGIRKRNLFQQFQQARKQLHRSAFSHDATLFALVLERLNSPTKVTFQADAAILKAMEEKIRFSPKRAQMSGNLMARLPSIIRAGFKGHYHNYAYGFRSIAQDLVLPSFISER